MRYRCYFVQCLRFSSSSISSRSSTKSCALDVVFLSAAIDQAADGAADLIVDTCLSAGADGYEFLVGLCRSTHRNCKADEGRCRDRCHAVNHIDPFLYCEAFTGSSLSAGSNMSCRELNIRTSVHSIGTQLRIAGQLNNNNPRVAVTRTQLVNCYKLKRNKR